MDTPDELREIEEQRAKWIAFVGNDVPDLVGGQVALGEALYTAKERQLFLDHIDSMSVEQCLQAWNLVEALRKKAYPDDLRM